MNAEYLLGLVEEFQGYADAEADDGRARISFVRICDILTDLAERRALEGLKAAMEARKAGK